MTPIAAKATKRTNAARVMRKVIMENSRVSDQDREGFGELQTL